MAIFLKGTAGHTLKIDVAVCFSDKIYLVAKFTLFPMFTAKHIYNRESYCPVCITHTLYIMFNHARVMKSMCVCVC